MTEGARTQRLAGSGVQNGGPIEALGIGEGLTKGQTVGNTLAGRHVHLIGIGGCGMCGAAGVLLQRQAFVSGSDCKGSVVLDRLAEQGVRVHVGQSGDNLPEKLDLVVYSAAVKKDNPELIAARQRGCKTIKYSQLLGLLMTDRVGIAIAGTHGKSTTTGMVAYILREAGVDPSFVIGADVEQLGGGCGVGDGKPFVVEACEYDRSFHHLQPRFATILNIEEDHLDYYQSLKEIIESFRHFASLVPADGLLVVNGEDRNALAAVAGLKCKIETFGFQGNLDWKAEILGSTQGCMKFRVLRGGKALTEVQLAIPGRHHVANALAAMAVCCRCGVEPETIARFMGQYRGARRRLTLRGRVAGVTVVDDYGHHPTEIQVTLKAAREYYNPRRMYVVFQPHQHSRTRFLLDHFAMSFSAADVVIVPDIYFVRDSESEKDLIDAKDLVRKIQQRNGDARYESSFDKIVSSLCHEVQEGDLVVTMGAGDVWKVADDLVACLIRTRIEKAKG